MWGEGGGLSFYAVFIKMHVLKDYSILGKIRLLFYCSVLSVGSTETKE